MAPMAGRHAANDDPAARHVLGEHREVARDSAAFWSYLDRLTLGAYARDFFTMEKHRWIIGCICGVLFIVAGVTRMFTDPGWRSLGVVLVGGALAVLFFVLPLVLDLVFAYAGAFGDRIRRPQGRRRRRRRTRRRR